MDNAEKTTLALALPDEGQFKRDMEAINRFQVIVHASLIPEQDFGIIPGTQKPTLLKPGAEKIAKLLGLADYYDVLDKVEDWNKPLFYYQIKCRLVNVLNGITVSEGLGSCNSMEGKYRWRDSKRKCPQCNAEAIIKGKEEWGGGWVCFKKQGGCGAKFEDNDPAIIEQKIGRVENDDIFTLVNTVLKMAKKRAMVDAALSAGRLSNVFTQDIEDIKDNAKVFEGEVVKPQPVKVAPVAPSSTSEAVVAKEASKESKQSTAKRDPATVKNFGHLYTACKEDWPESFPNREDVWKELGVNSQQMITETPAECYQRIASVRK